MVAHACAAAAGKLDLYSLFLCHQSEHRLARVFPQQDGRGDVYVETPAARHKRDIMTCEYHALLDSLLLRARCMCMCVLSPNRMMPICGISTHWSTRFSKSTGTPSFSAPSRITTR